VLLQAQRKLSRARWTGFGPFITKEAAAILNYLFAKGCIFKPKMDN